MVPRLARFVAAIVVLAGLAGASFAQEPLRFILVAHAQSSDPFWATIREGAEAAAQESGVQLEYSAPDSFDLDAMAALIHEAVAEKPAGLIVSIPNGDALAEPIKSAVAAGIPVISINSGFDVSASLGAMLHIGQSEYDAGRLAGESMRALGGSRALCLNHEVGNVALDLRCKGFIDGFGGSVQVVPVEPDPAAVSEALAELLTSDPNLDVVMALSASISGEPAIAAAKRLAPARQVRVGSFDATEPVLAAVAGGDASFAVDQQPFLQGYLPVQYLALFHRRGLAPVSDVRTGPRLVNLEEAARRLGRDLRRGAETEVPPANKTRHEVVAQ
jgi:simple sugar transport system substrate-binding protein